MLGSLAAHVLVHADDQPALLDMLTHGKVMVGLVTLSVSWAGYQVTRTTAEPDSVVTYKTIGNQALALHVFAAKVEVRHGRRPAALLLFHGGGWQHGSPSQFYPQCRHFRQLGITCIAVEYRTRTGHGGTPLDAVEDAQDALRFVLLNAATLDIDAGRVAAGGGSAGGQLAAALGTGIGIAPTGGLHASAEAASTRPAALVLLNPILDLSPGKPDHDLVGANWHRLSPLHHVDAATPPTLILNGTADPEVPVPTVQAFCQAVGQSGTTCEIALFEGAGHGFFNPQIHGGKHFAPANDAIAAFLKKMRML